MMFYYMFRPCRMLIFVILHIRLECRMSTFVTLQISPKLEPNKKKTTNKNPTGDQPFVVPFFLVARLQQHTLNGK